MKIGVKTFDNPHFLKIFENSVDFFEIMAIEKNDYGFLNNFNLPIVIHSQHKGFGINCADFNKKNINLNSIDFAKKVAEIKNSEKIILHPGEIDNKDCSIENAIEFIKSIKDNRIIIENIPLKGEYRICTKPKETKEFLDKTNKGFCFDINHAIETANNLKIDYISIIKEYVKLKPRHYHFGGQLIKKDITHLSLDESDFDIYEVLKIIPKNAEITLEVSMDINKTKKDVKIMKEFIEKIK